MKKLSPPSTDRFRPAITPPWALVSISTPPDMLVIAPASALTSPPGAIVITARANDGLNLMSTSTRRLLDRWRRAYSGPGAVGSQAHLAPERRQRKLPEREHSIVELAQIESRSGLGGLPGPVDLDHADHVGERLSGLRDVSVDLDHRIGVRHAALLEQRDRPLPVPAERVQARIGHEPGRAVDLGIEHAEALPVVDVQAHLVGQAFRVQAPAFGECAARLDAREATQGGPVGHLLLDRELEVMSGHGLVEGDARHDVERARRQVEPVHVVDAGALAVARRRPVEREGHVCLVEGLDESHLARGLRGAAEVARARPACRARSGRWRDRREPGGRRATLAPEAECAASAALASGNPSASRELFALLLDRREPLEAELVHLASDRAAGSSRPGSATRRARRRPAGPRVRPSRSPTGAISRSVRR